jgi:hypothetical protein
MKGISKMERSMARVSCPGKMARATKETGSKTSFKGTVLVLSLYIEL